MDQSGALPGENVLHQGGWVERPVRLYRDEWGIPHVRAQSVHDVFVGQGFAHAMDRLWQMNASRKQMEGRWAEWVGAAGLPADRLARRVRAGAASIRDYQALGADARAMVDAYTAGVNAYLRSHPAPPEYELVASAPEPWEGWHCIAAMRQRGYLMGSLWFKLWRAGAFGVVSAGDLVKLRYDDGGADRLCIPPGTDASRWIASLADLREPIRALSLLAASAETGGGSNNWALAPGRTATGRPILSGDPHRAFELPGMYAQMHLGCDQFDAIGLTIPGVPAFPHFAHNAQVAWCVTHAFADIHDLYVEQFDRAEPSRYRHQGDWLQAATAIEDITVRGGASAQVEIIETIHGPVVAGNPAHGSALTLKSVQFFDLDRSFDCLLPMLQASSVDSLYQAVRGWGLIDHNLVAADTGGHIGHLVRALVPRRPAINGWLPVPGWIGEYEWDGVIPVGQMPRVDDPARGYIVTLTTGWSQPSRRQATTSAPTRIRRTGPGELSSSSSGSVPRLRRTCQGSTATISARPPSCSRQPWPTSRRLAQRPVPSGTSWWAGMPACHPTRPVRPVTPGCAGLWPGSSQTGPASPPPGAAGSCNCPAAPRLPATCGGCCRPCCDRVTWR